MIVNSRGRNHSWWNDSAPDEAIPVSAAVRGGKLPEGYNPSHFNASRIVRRHDASILSEAKKRVEENAEKGPAALEIIEIDDDRVIIDGISLKRRVPE